MQNAKFQDPKNDELVKSRFSLPWREGIKGRGKITFKNTATYHPHPNPPPSMGRGFRTFYEIVNTVPHLICFGWEIISEGAGKGNSNRKYWLREVAAGFGQGY